MAGSYPDVPGRRMAWDDDGTIAGEKPLSQPFAEYSEAQQEGINNEQTASGPALGSNRWITFIFPELREVDGFFGRANAGNRIDAVATSGDTTNGIDGTWTQQTADYSDPNTNVYDDYRDGILSLAVSSARGARFKIDDGQGVRAAHWYGEISPGQTDDRLLFIDEATGLEFTLPKDYGDTPRGGSTDFEWRIKNNSASLIANNIQYTAEDLYLGSAAWYTHTLPAGSTFQSVQQIASLGAGTTSGIIKTRQIIPGGETLGLHAARLYLNVDTWS